MQYDGKEKVVMKPRAFAVWKAQGKYILPLFITAAGVLALCGLYLLSKNLRDKTHGEIEKSLGEIGSDLKESSRMVGGVNEKVGIILDELRGNRVDIAEAKCGASDDAPAKPSSLEDVLNSIKEDI